jgi:hypothetical protein
MLLSPRDLPLANKWPGPRLSPAGQPWPTTTPKHHLKHLGSDGVGELIWAMTTCRPDIAFTSVKLSQSNSAPAEHHYHGLKHAIRYLYTAQTDGIYFWRTTSPCLDLPEGPMPPVNSNNKDLLLGDCPDHDASIAVVYGDSDWATCVKTQRSFSEICVQLAGGTIAYKTKFQPTVVLSSTEEEFMAACNVG